MGEKSPEAQAELERLLTIAEDLVTYEQNREAIEAASDTLEAHRAEFEQLMSDPRLAMDYAQDLFSEDRFAHLRYTPEDIYRAFEKVGYPRFYREEPASEDLETILEAMLALVNKKERLYLSQRLLLFLPEYVAAGRYMDAWMIQTSAIQMVEFPGRSNPFLTSMFFLAYEEWQQQLETERVNIFRELGLDPSELEGMTGEEIESWFEAKTSDPDWEAEMERYYQDQPFARNQAKAQFYEMEQESVNMLERDDAQHLYLSREEVMPWVHEFLERQAEVIEMLKAAEKEGRESAAEAMEEVGRVMASVVVDMAESIFTPERKEQLAKELVAYRHQLRANGEHKAAHLIYTASTTVTYDESPAHNPFLTGLCFFSLRAILATIREEESDG